MKKKYKVVVIFGENAATSYFEGGLYAAKDCILNGDGMIIKKEFDTEAERNAYIEGCKDNDGWCGYSIVDDNDVKKHPRLINSMI